MDELEIDIRLENRETVYYYENSKIGEEDLQSETNSINVSKISKNANNKELFIFAHNKIDELKKEYNVIVSGRALMIIYPELDYHLFITASLDERTRRKAIQYEIAQNTKEYEELKNHIQNRDIFQEQAGFYKRYNNTIEIDVTECNTIEEETNLCLRQLKSMENLN